MNAFLPFRRAHRIALGLMALAALLAAPWPAEAPLSAQRASDGERALFPVCRSGKRVTYEYLITIQNNKKTAERVIVADQVPLSRNEKIVVKVIAPDGKEVKPTDEGTLKWTLELKPAEKRELTIKFTVDYPNDVNVSGLE